MSWPKAEDVLDVSEHQRESLETATSRHIGILTGGPGTGKTWSAASLLREVVRVHGVSQIAVCAPTGKAAVRITDALERHDVPLRATTAHRMLGVTKNGHTGDGWGFLHNEGNPLPQRFVVIDEFSMMSTDLCASVFAAFSRGTHVLMVGDVGQLPPVGHGAPLRDMIAAGVPCGELTEIQRNAGDIVYACRDIREGRAFRPSSVIDREAGHNLKHIETRSAAESWAAVESLLASVPADFDPSWDCQVVVAVNDKSDLSRKQLNKLMGPRMNPTGESAKACPFRVDDKVICLANGMLADAVNDKMFRFVANGEIGCVTKVAPLRCEVAFSSPSRTVIVSKSHLGDFDLAYAITVHRSQGSEWPIVIYISDEYRGARFVSSRQFIYTALSRAETLCITVGKLATIHADCRRDSLHPRKTFLKELLND